jgi:hypothetical protein
LVEKAGQEHQVEALALVHGVGLFVGDQALFQRLGAQLRSAFMPRPSSAIRMTMWSPSWRASRRTSDFSGLPAAPLQRRFDAVVDGIADQVDDRIGQVLDHRLVDLGIFAGQHQLDILAQAAGEVAGDARVFLEQAADRLHAGLHHRVLQVGHQQVELARRPASSACSVSLSVMPLRISVRRLRSGGSWSGRSSPDRLSTWSRREVSTRIELSRTFSVSRRPPEPL